MTKYRCTQTYRGTVYYVTLLADTEQQAREMATVESKQKGYSLYGGSAWNVSVVEARASGPARVLECGYQ